MQFFSIRFPIMSSCQAQIPLTILELHDILVLYNSQLDLSTQILPSETQFNISAQTSYEVPF